MPPLLFNLISINDYKLPNVRNYVTVSQTLPPLALNRELCTSETFVQEIFIVSLLCAKQTQSVPGRDYRLVVIQKTQGQVITVCVLSAMTEVV